MFIDGKLTAERARTDGALGGVAGYPLEIGHYTASRTQNFRGRIDELRLYNRALSVEEVQQEFERQLPLVDAERR